jgi:hypothetical protein
MVGYLYLLLRIQYVTTRFHVSYIWSWPLTCMDNCTSERVRDIYILMYVYILFTTNNLHYMFTTQSTMRQRQQLATAMWEWDGVWYSTWYGALYYTIHMDHCKVWIISMEWGIYTNNIQTREKKRNNIYIYIWQWRSGHVTWNMVTIQGHGVMEWWSDMIGYTHALSTCVCCILTSQCHSHIQL